MLEILRRPDHDQPGTFVRLPARGSAVVVVVRRWAPDYARSVQYADREHG
jgi:hypothetical protein